MQWKEWFRSASGEVLTKLCKQCPWDTLMCPPRYSLPGINIPHFRGLVSGLHMEWPWISLPKGRKGARGCHRLTEMVVNIYGPKKERINNAVSRVEVPLAESQTSFSGHRRCEAWEPVWKSLLRALVTFAEARWAVSSIHMLPDPKAGIISARSCAKYERLCVCVCVCVCVCICVRESVGL